MITRSKIGKGTKISDFAIVYECEIGIECDIRNYADLYKCKIGDYSKIETGVVIEKGVEIGKYNVLKPNTFIPTGIKTEDYVFVGSGVNFANDKHPKAYMKDWEELKTYIRKGASIGSGANILPGITIGECSLIGMGVTVLEDVPKNVIYKGKK